jgi:single-strand DNA-binding protein
MPSLNKVILCGNLTRDPELKFIPSGQAVCNFSMAMNRKWKSNTGEMKEDVTFMRVVVWGKSGEACAQYLKKGSPVLVEGRLQSRSWETPEGQKRSAVDVVAENVQFLGGNRSTSESGGEKSLTGGYEPGGGLSDDGPGPQAEGPTSDEDIPF